MKIFSKEKKIITRLSIDITLEGEDDIQAFKNLLQICRKELDRSQYSSEARKWGFETKYILEYRILKQLMEQL
jgi:hypothetical protein